jgi:putative membrane protein
MMHWDDGGGTGSWLGMAVVMLLSWVVLATLTYAVVRALLAGELPGPDRRPLPEELLDQRLARGDIDPEDYQRRKDLLVKPPAARDVKTG